MDVPARPGTGLPRQSYSRDEVGDIYELAKVWLESGQHKKAEALLSGLNEAAPDFAPAWLGTAFLCATDLDYEGIIGAASTALRLEPNSVEAMLFLVVAALGLKDWNLAGTYLGEIGDRVEQGSVVTPFASRFYKMQLARYQNRNQ